MVTETMVTTIDNPYDPFTEFRQWYEFDVSHGYHTAALLARISVTSEELSEKDQRQLQERAVDEIVSENVSGVFIKVTREVEE